MSRHVTSNFVDPPDDETRDFYADSPKGVIKSVQSGGQGQDNAVAAPESEIQNHRQVAYTDPHVHEAVYTLVDWLVGDGFNIAPRSFEDALEGGTGQIAAEVATGGELGADYETQQVIAAKLGMLLRTSRWLPTFHDWVYYAVVDGHSFMELVVENGSFDPRLLPTERMSRETDEYGRVIQYKLSRPEGGGGGGGGQNEDITYEPHEVAELYFRKEPTEDFGRSFIEPIAEVADILRDMEVDYARFVSTKAYPPILWKLGTDEERWTQDQQQAWMDSIEAIEPDSMLAAGHDVDYDVVGVTSTSSTAGAMRLEETFKHFQDRIITGLGIPALIMNMEGGSGQQGEAVSAMPAWKRRIRRLQNNIKTEVEQQVLKSLMFNSLEDTEGVVPEYEFGEYSSAEERLDADTAINLLNNGLLKPEAAARRAGIDPDTELPDIWDSSDLIAVLSALASKGDSIQNPEGGSPTGTGGGAESSGGEVTTRQNPGGDEDGRNRQSVTEDEST